MACWYLLKIPQLSKDGSGYKGVCGNQRRVGGGGKGGDRSTKFRLCP